MGNVTGERTLQLGSDDLSRLNLQQSVWYLGKAEPMWCGYSP
ncbi:hypothetical protein PTET_b0522 [Pseudoalteromonas tetraodonis]|nr:hypothetical protein PSM_B0416 [Pseudoalteromonas sp. SM9913]ATD05175.1 hypothetical protein PTET_b0522 [Pseudoalteromonas tetraodonis]